MATAIDTRNVPQETLVEAISFIAENLREADRDELSASVGGHPEVALFDSVDNSVRTFLILDRTSLPIGIFGVAAGPTPGLGVVWMMGTDGVLEEALSVARQTRRYVEELHELFPILWNYVDARNELSLKWLEWAGFDITDAHPNHGPEGRLFYEFSRIPD